MKTRSVFVMGVATGVAVGTLLAGLLAGPSASAQIAPLTTPRQAQGTRINLDERHQELVYANGFRLSTTNEEVIADMGLSMPNPNQSAANPGGELLFDVRMRLVMTYATAKRFQEGLAEAVRLYDERAKPATQPTAPMSIPGRG